ncbi:MAG: YihA family ribosome biogenesis GTP-binding protein [Paludibacteraceae bacterium]|nr:YihA family ribosome biogenesis GTP-binding protein [Paludibacteraceae bacterium]MBP5481749.1 YihA family ribosome biogenesis GTP-binding protein [Paludibacteraceae bacterium]
MEVKKAVFVESNSDWSKCPKHLLPEFAFIGRSNVGKSSLINKLTNQKSLAKTSSTPGKTLLINHFLVNDSWYLVDLPGYGFAKIGMEGRAKLDKMIKDYVLHREELFNLFVLIDCRHEPQKNDLEFIEFLGANGVPFSIIFTKADKLSKSKLSTNVQAYKNKLLEEWEELPPIFVTSSETGLGKDELLDYIDSIMKVSPDDSSVE